MIRRSLRRTGTALALGAIVAVALAGCGGDDGAGGSLSVPGLPLDGESLDTATLGGQVESAPFLPETSAPPEEPAAPASTPTPARPGKGTPAVVQEVVDGDTIRLRNGKVVRLAQIDAPEERECHGAEATAALERLLPAGTRIRLQRDAALDDVDRYGRLVRYVVKGSATVNRALVRAGHASVWFFDGGRGRLADTLLADATRAQERGLGLWGACPKATLDPSTDVESGDA
ncbi:MAG: thermonuclease family protein [Thermoleophilia bacterium]